MQLMHRDKSRSGALVLGSPRTLLVGVAFALCLAGAGSGARAQPVLSVDGRGAVYQDNDATTIITSALGAKVDPDPRLSVNGQYLIDVVTTASVDVVAAATGRWDELRHQGSVGVGYRDSDRSISGGYIASVENDWVSHTGTLALSHDFFDHQLTLGASGSFGFNAVGRSDDPNFEEQLFLGSASLEATVVASRDDLLSISYSLLIADGYQASPYRFVRFFASSPQAAISEPESPPDDRLRHAVSVRWNRHLFQDTALRTSARAYLDNWGVASGTLGVEWAIGLSQFEITPSARAYLQRRASFYREVYDQRLEFMTADRELSTFVDVFAGLGAGYRVTGLGIVEELRIDIKATGFYFRYFDYYPLASRLGFIGELGTGISF